MESSQHKSKVLIVKELLDIAVPPGQKNAALRTLFQTIVEELGIQYAETNVSRVPENVPKLELNVQEIIADISKTLDAAIRGWIKCNRYTYGSSCRELADFLRNHGFPGYAEYLENCMNDTSQHEEIVPLLWKNPERHPSNNLLAPITEFEPNSGHREKRLRSCHPYFQHPLASFALISFGFVLGFLSGLGISFLLTSKGCSVSTSEIAEMLSISSTITTTQTLPSSTEFPITATSPTYCKPENDNRNSSVTHLSKIMPDWSQKILNLCNSPDPIVLVVVGENLVRFTPPGQPLPEVLCPERVLGIEFISQEIHWRTVQHFVGKLCRLEKLSFVGMGRDNCSTDKYISSPPAASSASISSLHIEGFMRCPSLFLEMPKAQLNLDKVVEIRFKCVEFTRNPDPLQSFINAFPNLESVNCLNNNNCVAFNAKMSRGISLISGYVQCLESVGK